MFPALGGDAGGWFNYLCIQNKYKSPFWSSLVRFGSPLRRSLLYANLESLFWVGFVVRFGPVWQCEPDVKTFSHQRDNHVTALMGFVTQRPEFVTQARIYVTIT